MVANSEKPKVAVKSKNIQTVIDYCLEQKIEFTVSPRNATNDEWEVEINLKSIIKAIEFGIFMKSNRLELVGSELFTKSSIVAKPNPVKSKPAKEIKNAIVDEEPVYQEDSEPPLPQTQTSVFNFGDSNQ